MKDKTELFKESNVIYKINCQNYNSNYIGTTKQYLKNRISQHKSSIKITNSNKTALSEHCINLDHTFDFDNTKILCKENNQYKRYILEMLYIKNSKNSINFKTDYQNLSNVYEKIL